jgi:hypothetical protein
VEPAKFYGTYVEAFLAISLQYVNVKRNTDL